MLYDYIGLLWTAIMVTILVCELYVPYKKRLFLSFAAAAAVCSAFSDYMGSVFIQCVFFAALSLLIYAAAELSGYIMRKKKGRNAEYASVIALCDIPDKGFGAVYCMGKSHVIKNRYGKFIKKGEALQIGLRELYGERLV